MKELLKSPYPFFGGKGAVADVVWQRLGNVQNYVEPFFGSGAVLLRRPHEPKTETVNDIDAMISNLWRSVQAVPDKVAYHADWPSNENCLHARHAWLVGQKQSLQEKLEGDPDYYDAKIAGWWLWGMSLWIGSGFCSGKGPWVIDDGKLVKSEKGYQGKGISRQRIHLSSHGQGISALNSNIYDWMEALSARLKRVRVTCCDWSRICGYSPTIVNGLTGVFLDPPYGEKANRDAALYTQDSLTVADDVRTWCIQNEDHKLMRIALCGYVGEHEELQEHGWDAYYWSAQGGYGNQSQGRGRDNAKREVIWFSPHCLKADQLTLFGQ
jgi:DNA adenine methylase